MDNLQMWSLFVGAGLPPLVALAQQPKWDARTRAALTLGVCLLAGIGTAWAQGELTGRGVSTSALTVLVAALSTYKGFWKPTGVAGAIEGSTSPSPSPEPSPEPSPAVEPEPGEPTEVL